MRSRGGLSFLSEAKEVQGLSSVLGGIEGSFEDGECSLIEEEYLLSVIQPEKLASYATQLSFLLKSFIKLSEMLTLADGESKIYSWVNSED